MHVRATPVAYGWVFGDGTRLGPTASAGAPWPEADITHTYTAPGAVADRVDVSWAGTFAVAGGPAVAIPGQMTVAGPEVPVLVREARSELVATPAGDPSPGARAVPCRQPSPRDRCRCSCVRFVAVLAATRPTQVQRSRRRAPDVTDQARLGRRGRLAAARPQA